MAAGSTFWSDSGRKDSGLGRSPRPFQARIFTKAPSAVEFWPRTDSAPASSRPSRLPHRHSPQCRRIFSITSRSRRSMKRMIFIVPPHLGQSNGSTPENCAWGNFRRAMHCQVHVAGRKWRRLNRSWMDSAASGRPTEQRHPSELGLVLRIARADHFVQFWRWETTSRPPLPLQHRRGDLQASASLTRGRLALDCGLAGVCGALAEERQLRRQFRLKWRPSLTLAKFVQPLQHHRGLAGELISEEASAFHGRSPFGDRLP